MSTTQGTHRTKMKPYATTTTVLVEDDLSPWAETGFTASAAYRPQNPATHHRSERMSSGTLARSVLLSASLAMPLMPADDLLASTSSFTSASPQEASPKTTTAAPESLADAEESQWRGILAIEHGDEVLFTKRIDITPGKLDEWEFDPVISYRPFDEDDD